MKKHVLYQLVIFYFCLMIGEAGLQAQNGENFDFSYGNFTNWTGKTGNFIGLSNSTYELTTSYTSSQLDTVISNTHCYYNKIEPYKFFINQDTNEYDTNVYISGEYVLRKIPKGYTHSVRLGNTCSGGEVDALYYQFTVSENTPYLILMYSLVLSIHPEHKYYNPIFNIEIKEIINDTTNVIIPCTSLLFCAYLPEIPANDASFMLSYRNYLLCKKWTPYLLNIEEYIGKKLEIKITVSDCSQGGHFGYAYFTGKFGSLHLEANTNSQTNSDTVAYAVAPEGLFYKWIKSGEDISDSNTRILSNQQKLHLTENDFEGNASLALDCYINSSISEVGCPFKLSIVAKNKKPIVDIQYQITDNFLVSFDSTTVKTHFAAIDESSHRWDFGDGFTSKSKTPTHLYVDQGTYMVTYTVSTLPDSEGQTYTITKKTKITIIQPVTGISLNPKLVRLKKKKTIQLQVTIYPNNATDQSIKWISRNPETVKVDSVGNLTPVEFGSTYVSVITNDGEFKDSCLVKVLPQTTGVAIYKKMYLPIPSMEKGETITLHAVVQPNNAEQLVSWESSDPNIIVIDSTGKVFAISEGEAYIIATTIVDNYQASAHITVKAAKNEEEVNISEINTTNLPNIYPNPTTGIFNIESKELIRRVELLDNTGKILHQNFNIALLQYQFNLYNQSLGTYFLRIITNKGVVVRKIIKQ